MVSVVPERPLLPISKKPNSIKPLLRKSNLSGTIRKSDDAGLLSQPPSPKKQKHSVTFSSQVEERVMDGYRSVESVRGEVRRAIEAHQRGDSEGFDHIKEIFTPRRRDQEPSNLDSAEMRQYLLALTNCCSSLGRNCKDLVASMLACQWMGRDEAFVKSYVQFLGSLVSAQGMYVGSVLGMLVVHFLGVRLSSGRLPGYADVNRDQLFTRVHAAMKYLLRLIPSASSTLSPIISSKFPQSEDTKKAHLVYVENLVRLYEYAPELKLDIFALITDRVVKIDVQTQVDLDELDDAMTAEVVQAISLDPSRQEELEDEESDADSIDSDESGDEEAQRIKELHSNVEKMDAMLDVLFTIYTPYFSDPHSVEAAAMFDTLLGHFTNIILPTYRSRHTQFLLFHFAQRAEHLVDQFAGTCVQLAFQTSRPAILRQSSAAYLASFVARGAHVPRSVVLTVFELIGNNLEHIRAEHELTCRGPDLQRYSTFYAMTQALLYIFCFRWRDLLASDGLLEDDDPALLSKDLEWVTGIRETLRRAIHSKLNPLKICSPAIVTEFAKVAFHLGFMYIHSLLETNKRVRLSQFASGQGIGALRSTGNGGNDESWHQLEDYFPFDPYQLPISKRWVEADYLGWRSVPGLEPDDEDDSEGDDDEAEEMEVKDDTATDDE